jgi:RNA polymerase sigma-70 factor (ECF subfamily)
VVRALVAAAEARDERGLSRMLHPGIRLTVDGGGVVAAPSSPLEGRSAASAFLIEALSAPAALRVEAVNGIAGVVRCADGRVTGVLGLRSRGRLLVEAWLVVNPDKLTRWRC